MWKSEKFEEAKNKTAGDGDFEPSDYLLWLSNQQRPAGMKAGKKKHLPKNNKTNNNKH